MDVTLHTGDWPAAHLQLVLLTPEEAGEAGGGTDWSLEAANPEADVSGAPTPSGHSSLNLQ